MLSIIYIFIAVISVIHAETTDTTQQPLLETSSISPTTVETPSNTLSAVDHHIGIINLALDIHKNLINSNIEEDDMEAAESSIVFMPLFATRRKAERRKAQKRKHDSNSESVTSSPHKTHYYYAPPYYYTPNYRPSYSDYPSYPNYPSYSNNYPSYPAYSNNYQSNSQYPTYYYPSSSPTYEYPNYYP